jgi:CheY-like chemotaxis protein
MNPMSTRASECTILVVDDDEEIRETLADLLEHEGYCVVRAENGVQALEQLRRVHPNCMLLDLMMPVMSGWEVIEELQRSGEIDATPFVVVSAMCAPGAYECLQKPVDLDELLDTVARCCGASAPAPQAAAHF